MEENNEPEEQPEQEYVAELIDESVIATDPTSEDPIILAEDSNEPKLGQPAVVYSPAVAAKPTARQQAAIGRVASAKPPEVLENLAAKGGAVGALVLGILALLGSFITSYAVLNAAIGLLMGVWGLSSKHQRMAGIGMVLCLISAFFCAIKISDWLPSLG